MVPMKSIDNYLETESFALYFMNSETFTTAKPFLHG